jgi:competence protein ComFA
VILQYGKSPHQWKQGSLCVATAHQAYRYFRRFSLAILDEPDAFPLDEDGALFQGIQRSLAEDARQIYVTATPPARLKREMPNVILPVRYHGFPLPVPKLLAEPGLWTKIAEGKPIESVQAFLRHVRQTDGQALLFVPRVPDVPKVVEWLARVYGCKALGVTGRSEDRDHRIEQVRSGKQDVLVTTTLLERGVTFPYCHVLVLGADHPIFDRSTLMQIAGRVGRKADYQKGIVCFIASVKTEAQIQVKKELIWLNKLAATKKDFAL